MAGQHQTPADICFTTARHQARKGVNVPDLEIDCAALTSKESRAGPRHWVSTRFVQTTSWVTHLGVVGTGSFFSFS